MSKLYYRFGEIPKDEKSAIWYGEECIGYEDGVSVYEAHRNNEGIYIPVIPYPKTDTTFNSYAYYLNYFRGHHYLLKGDVVGKGNDGEPLIKNIIIKKILK